jgi:hypothetical protein
MPNNIITYVGNEVDGNTLPSYGAPTELLFTYLGYM